jgi:hypothetical protein
MLLGSAILKAPPPTRSATISSPSATRYVTASLPVSPHVEPPLTVTLGGPRAPPAPAPAASASDRRREPRGRRPLLPAPATAPSLSHHAPGMT